ncbi:MAG: ABC transporter permease subunit, partial [Anaerolineales bacterium]|nr:ABC transporter permease subunit [Anaerolineales bacterium]
MLQALQDALAYASTHLDELRQALVEHLLLVGVALAIGILLCVPLGIWTSREQTRVPGRARTAALAIMNTINGLRVVPSLAILFLAIPYFGLTFASAALALTILALPPILINTDAAYRTLDPAVRESATGMGMTARQVLWRVETPLA